MVKEKLLCVCAKGQNRSRYLAEYLNKEGYDTRYGGVEGYDKTPGQAPNQLKQEDVDWAEIIIIVRERLKAIFEKQFETNEKRIIVLDISDLTGEGKGETTKESLRKAIKPYLPLN
jgi:predicted protein tyrosine phosphatase